MDYFEGDFNIPRKRIHNKTKVLIDKGYRIEYTDQEEFNKIKAQGADYKAAIFDYYKSDMFLGLTKQELEVALFDPYWIKFRKMLSTVFRIILFFSFLFVITWIMVQSDCSKNVNSVWLQRSPIYQINVRSYYDSDNDGVGDLAGVTEKLNYLRDQLNISTIWLTHIYKSSMEENSHGIINHTEIDPEVGKLEDFVELVNKIHILKMKIILDLIPNQTSDQHKWFTTINNFKDYYIWNSSSRVPNNWINRKNSAAWTYSQKYRKYFFHSGSPVEPDLNLKNPAVIDEIKEIVYFWLKKHVDGLFIHEFDYLMESNVTNVGDESKILTSIENNYIFDNFDHNYTIMNSKSFSFVNDICNYTNGFQHHMVDKVVIIISTKGSYEIINKKFDKMQSEFGLSSKSEAHEAYPDGIMYISLDTLAGDCLITCIYRKVTSILGNRFISDDNKKDNLIWTMGLGDESRISSKFGKKWASAFNMLIMSLPGIPIIYYGQELGMKDSVFNATDMDELNSPYVQDLENQQRNPMQWKGIANAGFTMAEDTWIPISKDYKRTNVQTEISHGIGPTILESLHNMSTLRKREKSLVFGDYYYIYNNENTFSFVRRSYGYPSILVAINFGSVAATCNFTYQSIIPANTVGTVAVTTTNMFNEMFNQGNKVRLHNVFLRPAEGVVFIVDET